MLTEIRSIGTNVWTISDKHKEHDCIKDGGYESDLLFYVIGDENFMRVEILCDLYAYSWHNKI